MLKGALSLLLLICMEETAFCGWSLSRIAAHCTPSVVRVLALDGRDGLLAEGKGFFLDEGGTLATTYHISRRASRVVVECSGGEKGELLEVTGADPTKDLLIARTTLRGTRAVNLGDSRKSYPGEEILVLGITPGGNAVLSPGDIAGIQRLNPVHLFHMTAPILPGWSGAPVFNVSGEVIGMAVAFLTLGEDLSIAVPVHYLNEMESVSRRLHELPERTARLEAALREETLIEVLVREGGPAVRPPRRNIESRQGPEIPIPGDPSRMGTGVVQFRDGRKLRVEKAWRDGDRILLVMPGRRFAVSYDALAISRLEPLAHFGPEASNSPSEGKR
jgi:S1-C subfamily serine protease